MRVRVVSDVHGNADDLKRAADGVDALFVLGDLIDFVDYHDYSGGILGRIFGADAVAEFARLRRGHVGGEVGAYARSLWDSLDDPAAVVREAVAEQYERLFAAMPVPCYVTPGNVDAPQMWPDLVRDGLVRDGVRLLDGETVTVGGLRVGFVGGALLPQGRALRPDAPWRPYLRDARSFRTAVHALGDVDVLCSHIPPAVPDLIYDVMARRPEQGSVELTEAIERASPRWSLFGHVHQPLAPRVRVGRTECVNVGHFQRTGNGYVISW